LPTPRQSYQTTIREALTHVFETGQPARYEVEARGPHGTLAWYSTVLSPVMRGDSVYAATLITRDTTARKRAEQELRESEAKLKLLIDHAPVSLAMFDRDMRYLAVSTPLDHGLFPRRAGGDWAPSLRPVPGTPGALERGASPRAGG
jgi:PAS domain-containing protein